MSPAIDRCGPAEGSMPHGQAFEDPGVFRLLIGKLLKGWRTHREATKDGTVMCSLRCIHVFILDLRYSALTPFKNCS